ncbi:hypothetical protein ACHAP8_009333 [Fusarium lateritium]
MGSRAGASRDCWVMQIVEPDFNPGVGKIWKAHQRKSPGRSAEQGQSARTRDSDLIRIQSAAAYWNAR